MPSIPLSTSGSMKVSSTRSGWTMYPNILPHIGWRIRHRVNYVEKNWPYFLGFGLPLAILTAMPSSLVIRLVCTLE